MIAFIGGTGPQAALRGPAIALGRRRAAPFCPPAGSPPARNGPISAHGSRGAPTEGPGWVDPLHTPPGSYAAVAGGLAAAILGHRGGCLVRQEAVAEVACSGPSQRSTQGPTRTIWP